MFLAIRMCISNWKHNGIFHFCCLMKNEDPSGRALYIKFIELSLNLKEGKLNSFHTLYTPITLQICLLGDPYGFEAAGGGETKHLTCYHAFMYARTSKTFVFRIERRNSTLQSFLWCSNLEH